MTTTMAVETALLPASHRLNRIFFFKEYFLLYVVKFRRSVKYRNLSARPLLSAYLQNMYHFV